MLSYHVAPERAANQPQQKDRFASALELRSVEEKLGHLSPLTELVGLDQFEHFLRLSLVSSEGNWFPAGFARIEVGVGLPLLAGVSNETSSFGVAGMSNGPSDSGLLLKTPAPKMQIVEGSGAREDRALFGLLGLSNP